MEDQGSANWFSRFEHANARLQLINLKELFTIKLQFSSSNPQPAGRTDVNLIA